MLFDFFLFHFSETHDELISVQLLVVSTRRSVTVSQVHMIVLPLLSGAMVAIVCLSWLCNA